MTHTDPSDINLHARYTTTTAVIALTWQDDDAAVQSPDDMIQATKQPASLLSSIVRTPSLVTAWDCIVARQQRSNASPTGSQTPSVVCLGQPGQRLVTTNQGTYRFSKAGHAFRTFGGLGLEWHIPGAFQTLPQLRFPRVSKRMGELLRPTLTLTSAAEPPVCWCQHLGAV